MSLCWHIYLVFLLASNFTLHYFHSSIQWPYDNLCSVIKTALVTVDSYLYSNMSLMGDRIQSHVYMESTQGLLRVTVLVSLAFCPLLKLSLLSGKWEEMSIK